MFDVTPQSTLKKASATAYLKFVEIPFRSKQNGNVRIKILFVTTCLVNTYLREPMNIYIHVHVYGT